MGTEIHKTTPGHQSSSMVLVISNLIERLNLPFLIDEKAIACKVFQLLSVQTNASNMKH